MKNFKWTIEIEVSETWVRDGFNLDKGGITHMLSSLLPFAYEHEFSGKIISAPDPKEIEKAQS